MYRSEKIEIKRNTSNNCYFHKTGVIYSCDTRQAVQQYTVIATINQLEECPIK